MRTITSLGAILLASALAACSPPAEAPREPAGTAATAPGAEADGTYTFTIGDLTAIALSDGALEFPNDNEVLGVGHTPEQVASLLTAAGLPGDRFELSVHPLLVKAGDRVLLFDTGAGGNMGPSGGKRPAMRPRGRRRSPMPSHPGSPSSSRVQRSFPASSLGTIERRDGAFAWVPE